MKLNLSNRGKIFVALLLIAASISTAPLALAELEVQKSSISSSSLVTCLNFNNGRESISKTGICPSTQAMAKWHLASSDTASSIEPSSKQLVICANGNGSSVEYKYIRTACSKHQVRSIYNRSVKVPSVPVITNTVEYSDQSASMMLATDPAENLDAPIAFYTVSISGGETRKIKNIGARTLAIGGLNPSTTYTFTVTATNVDGTSEASKPSEPVTTKKFIPPIVFSQTSTSPVLSCAAGGVCEIGDIGPGGGTIFYVASTSFACGPTLNLTCTYLEVAPTSGVAAWSDAQLKWSSDDSQFDNSGGDRTEIGAGLFNTLAMLAVNGNYSGDTSEAAYATSQYSGPNSKNDWYLPSKDELNQLCKWQRGQAWVSDSTVCSSSGSLNSSTYGATNAGFVTGNYWSSTESQRFPWQSTGWNQEFQSGSQNNASGKNFQLYTRAIRAF